MTHFSYKVTYFRRLSKVVQGMILHILIILKSKNICFLMKLHSRFLQNWWNCNLAEKVSLFSFLSSIMAKFNFKLICRLKRILASKFIVILYVFFIILYITKY